MIAELDYEYIRKRPKKAYERLVSHIAFQGRHATTGHRWMNVPIRAFLSLTAELPALRRVDRPIFIVGTGRSGSTILGKVLSIHPDIGFLNEPKAIWYTINHDDDVHGHYREAGGDYLLDAARVDEATRRKARRIFGTYLFVTGTRRVLDKSPEIIYRTSYIQGIFPDAKFLWLVRNGWDTVQSIASWSRQHHVKRKGRREDWWGVDRKKWSLMVRQLVQTEPELAAAESTIAQFNRETDMAAVEWILAMRAGLRLMRSSPDCVYQIRFEKLAGNGGQVIRDIQSFCELEDDSVLVQYAEEELRPVVSRPKTPLAEEIGEAFQSTMQMLGYE